MSPGVSESPLFSIIMPVFNRARFLEKSIQSALTQTYPDFELVIYDDCSTDPGVGKVLKKYIGTSQIKMFRGQTNQGISMATNQAIIKSTGKYLAFFDCDDLLSPNALEIAAGYIKLHPHAHYFYSNRENIDEEGRIINRMDFAAYDSKRPDEQILNFMFATHLKIIKKDSLHEVGLFKKEFDTCQDYDMALRMSQGFNFCHIPEYLYQYRIHPEQVSQSQKKEQALLSFRAREVEMVKRKLIQGDIGNKKISIIILTMNRWQRTRITLYHLLKNTGLPFELIILDNNSSDETAQFLQWFSKQHSNVKLILEGCNLGCAGGRERALKEAEGDFIVTLDNDITVTPRWLENLLVRLKESCADAACCKVVLPDGKIQYNGGFYRISGRFILFSFIDSSLSQDSLESLIFRDCDWLPGGSTLYRRTVFDKVAFCGKLYGGMEDNDLSLQMKKSGLKMVNSPLSRVIHHHARYEIKSMQDPAYSRERYDWGRLKETMVTFYRRNGLIVYDPWLFARLGIPCGTRQETENYFLLAL